MYYHPSAQPMKSIPFFRAGSHVDSHGRAVEFSEADLAASIAGYDPALYRAPLVIGHPKDNGPAYGWVKSLAFNAQGEAAAVPEHVHTEFAEGVAARTWYPRSASWYAPQDPRNPKPGIYYLRHIGFLGAQPPAIKGLSDIEFDDGADVLEIEFSDYGHQIGAGLWRRLRDWLIGERGLETADKVIPNWEIDSLNEIAQRPEPDQPAPVFSEPPTPEVTTVTPEQAAALEAENTRLKQQVQQHQDDKRSQAQQATHAEHLAYAEQLVAAGMKPAHVGAVVAALDFAEASETPLEFGEGDERQPLVDGLRAVFAELAGGIDFSEQARRERADPSQKTPANPLVADAEARSKH